MAETFSPTRENEPVLDLSPFTGPFRQLVEAYVQEGVLKNQEDISKYAAICREAKQLQSGVREYIFQATKQAFGKRLDIYNDPELLGIHLTLPELFEHIH